MHHTTNWTHKAIRLGAIVLLLLVPLALIPILAGWVGDIAKEWIVDPTAVSAADLRLLRFSLIGLLGLVALVVWKGRKLLPTRVLAQTPEFVRRRVVIALLSPCKNLRELPDGQWEVHDQHAQAAPRFPLAGKELAQLVTTTPGMPNWSWQQTLRGAHFHGAGLERLVLVGSLGPGGSGSKEQMTLADRFFSTWFPGKVAIYGAPADRAGAFDHRWQADFEDLNALSNLLRNILRELHRDAGGFRDRDIIIDCTGGFKVTSIAAALVTLDRTELMFQYVNNSGQVTGFDVATEYYGT